MDRDIDAKLLAWKAGNNRRPLILRGARQTGKTYAITQFGTRMFRELHYLNFQETKRLHQIFAGDLEPQRLLESIEFALDRSIDINADLIFFDEIQDCSQALNSLKYFHERMPHLAICAAGSLLGVTHTETSFPVGKVSFLDLYPMSFGEFLLALGEHRSYDIINNVSTVKKIPNVAHEHLMGVLREYFVVGGMPDVVAQYARGRDNKRTAFRQVRETQKNLLSGFVADFAKYSGKVKAREITAIFESIPSQLARESKKFKASSVVPGGRFSKLLDAVDWLEGAGLIIRVKIANSGELPFAAFTKANRFKLYFFDVGLLGALAGLSPSALYQAARPFSTFKGAFCENFVAQEFCYAGHMPLHAWASNTAEIEFLLEINGQVYPVEVKAGVSGKLKSLAVFAKKYGAKRRIRISAHNLQIDPENDLHTYPLYLASRFPITPHETPS